VTQEIIDELAKVNQFRLSAFTSTVMYKNSSKSLDKIADELDVQLILTGSARIFNDSVRLSIELVDPYSNQRIWNRTYDDRMSHTFHLQGDIARHIVDHLNVNLSQHEKSELEKINTKNPEAYDLLLRARASYSKLTKEGYLQSIQYLNKAIGFDPDFAHAYTFLSWVYILYGFADMVGDAESASITVEKAKPLIDKAMELDPKNADNYLVMGALDLFYLNNINRARTNVEKAIEINAWPQVPTRYCICTAISTFSAMGDLDRAAEFVKISKKIDPGNVFVFSDEGIVNILMGNHEQAVYAFKQAYEFMDVPFFRYYLGWAYYHGGDYKNALQYLLSAVENEDAPLGNALAFISNTYFKTGNYELSNRYQKILFDRFQSGLPNQIIPLAMIEAARGQTEETLKYLEIAYSIKEFGFSWYLNIDPVFDAIRDHPGFIELQERPSFDGK
jgi:tetratricopeptide (TPR) repeat protein